MSQLNNTQKLDKIQTGKNDLRSCLSLLISYKTTYWLNRTATAAKRELAAWRDRHEYALSIIGDAFGLLIGWTIGGAIGFLMVVGLETLAFVYGWL